MQVATIYSDSSEMSFSSYADELSSTGHNYHNISLVRRFILNHM